MVVSELWARLAARVAEGCKEKIRPSLNAFEAVSGWPREGGGWHHAPRSGRAVAWRRFPKSGHSSAR